MVAAELAGAIESIGSGILVFVNFGITILVIMFIVELFRLFTGTRVGSAVGNVTGPVADLASRAGLRVKKGIDSLLPEEQQEEKFELKKYYSLKRMEKDLKDIHAATSDKDLKNALNSDDRKVRRDESRAVRRLQRLESDIQRANLDAAVKARVDPIVREIEIYNNKVLVALKRFDETLDKPLKSFTSGFVQKKNFLLGAVREAIAAEQALLAEMQKLNTLFKK